jgi:small-conductance mechanosensitive channel
VELAADPTVSVDALRVVEGDGVTRIVAGSVPVITIVDADAVLEQVNRTELAVAHLMRLRQGFTDYREARSSAAVWRGVIRSLTATLVLAIMVVVLRWYWRWIDRVLERRLHRRIQTVGIQSFELMRAEQIWGAVRALLVSIRAIVFLTIALVYLGFVLAQFPWTRWLSRDMVGFALGPIRVIGSGLVANIPSLVFLAVLFLVVRVALKLIRLFFDSLDRGAVKLAGFDAEWALPTYKIVRIAVVAFGIIVAYPYIPGSDSAAFQGVTVFLGIVFSLGSSTAISNTIAGYMLTYRRAFKIGDRVKIGTSVGEVIATRLQVTHLRSPKNEELIIPNSQILSGEVLNYSSLSQSRGLILHTQVGIGYETPWRQVEAMLLLAASRTAGLLKEPRPFVLERALGDFAVTYELNAYCNDPGMMLRLYAEMHRQILDVFNEHGVQIMTPAYEGDPPEPKIVRPDNWYAAPAARPDGDAASAEPPGSLLPVDRAKTFRSPSRS